MKRLLSTTVLFFLLAASAFAITAQEEQQIVDQTLAAFGKAPFELPDTISVHRLCGTSIIMDARERFNELSPASQTRLQGILATRPSLPQFFDVPLLGGQSGPGFKVHYAVTGPDSVRNASIDLRGFGSPSPNGVPDWVDTVGLILDSIWIREVDQMGFRPPLSDGSCPAGDGPRFDVYLQDIGGLYLGYTDNDGSGCYQQNRATAFIGLDNDYAGLSGYPEPDGPRQVLRVTAAHEFFHAIQFAYNAFGAEVAAGTGPYWYEATAVWMEEQVYSEINDYIQYLPFWFRKPELSFRTFSSNTNDPDRVLHPYALGIYGIYLSKRFPSYPVVRRVWESMATVSGFNLFQALDSTLGFAGFMPGAAYPQRFLASLQEFYRWNYFVGAKVPLNAPDTLYGNEAAVWPTFELFDQVDSTSNYPTQHPEVFVPCNSCHPNVIRFFCAPCFTNTAGSICSTKCPPSCRFVPFQPTSINVIDCVNDIEDLGVSYLNLQNPGGGSFMEFALVSDTGRPAPWVASAAGYNTGSRTYTFLSSHATDPSGQIPEVFFPDFGNYTEVVVMVMNNELLTSGAARQSSAYAYSANVDSSAPPGVTGVLYGRPNPFRPEIDGYVKFPVDLDSLSGTWDITLFVFSPAGEVVYKKDYELQGGFPYTKTVNWAGKNGSNEPVASGVYFCKIIMEEKGTSRKVEKVSKVALIRQ